MFNLPPPLPNRVARAGLAIFARATMALAPNAVWAQATDPFQPIAPAIEMNASDAAEPDQTDANHFGEAAILRKVAGLVGSKTKVTIMGGARLKSKHSL